jgi:hypothetical protein
VTLLIALADGLRWHGRERKQRREVEIRISGQASPISVPQTFAQIEAGSSSTADQEVNGQEDSRTNNTGVLAKRGVS